MELNSYRYSLALNKGLSFPTISALGENAAIIHYMPKKDSAKLLTRNEIYLLDSGG